MLKTNGKKMTDQAKAQGLMFPNHFRKSIFLNLSLGNYGKWKKAGEITLNRAA